MYNLIFFFLLDDLTLEHNKTYRINFNRLLFLFVLLIDMSP